METKVYKPQPGNLILRRIVGAIFTLTGGGLGCAFMMVGLLFLPLMASSEDVPPEAWLLALAFPGMGLIFGLVFVGVGIMTFRSGRNDQIELSQETLTQIQGKAVTRLSLSDIAGLSGQWRRRRRGRGHWAVLISDRAGQTIELAVSQGGYLGTFDALSILKDLIPQLAATVAIDPRIQEYMSTGKIG